MKGFNRAAAGVLAAVMILSTAACKDTADPSAADTSAASVGATEDKTASDLNVGICIYDFDDNFMTLYREELKNYLMNEYGIAESSINVMDSRDDPAGQISLIDDLFIKGVDVLIVNLVQASDAKTVADKCQEAGIPVVFINSEPEEAEIKRWEDEAVLAAYVGADARQSGTFQGEIILETPNRGDFNGDKTVSYVMITGDPGNIDTQYRTEYAVRALEDAGMKTENLYEQCGDWDQAKGRELAADALTRFGSRIEVIFCNNDAMANGAREAIMAAGRTVGRDIYLVGVDALEETVGYVIDGTVTGTVLNDHIGQSHTAADTAVKMASGEAVDRIYTVDYIKVIAGGSRPIPVKEPEGGIGQSRR